jgi:phenylalanine-4-hydroxylase
MSLTATRANDLWIHQPQYSAEAHQTWRRLYERILPRWELYANRHFLEGVQCLSLPPDRIPRLGDVNHFLKPRTGFEARAVAGYVPAFVFFDCLRNRIFPTTVTIRPANSLDYLPEPDIFHDVAGHVPMHTDQHFAETLVHFGQCAHTAVDLVAGIRSERERMETLTSILKAMARFFWFSIEFGLMKQPEGMRVYGSGLLSSFGEIEHAIESPEVRRAPLQLETVIHQDFKIDRYQQLLFFVDSFDHLYSLVGQLEKWMKEGKLNHVAPGEPELKVADLESFLAAAVGQVADLA